MGHERFISFVGETNKRSIDWMNDRLFGNGRLFALHDTKSRLLYCEEMGVSASESVSEECWNKMDARIKWLYRRAVIHRELLHSAINFEDYCGKCLGIRMMA